MQFSFIEFERLTLTKCFDYASRRLQHYVSSALSESPSLMMTDLRKEAIVHAYLSCASIFRARSSIKMKLQLDYLSFVRHAQIKWTPSMLANYFLLPLTELYRIAEIARAVRSTFSCHFARDANSSMHNISYRMGMRCFAPSNGHELIIFIANPFAMWNTFSI